MIPVGLVSSTGLVSAAKCEHPRAVRVVVRENVAGKPQGTKAQWPEHLPTTTYMVTPEVNLPKTPAIAGEGHDWKAHSYAHLFWLIGRDDDEEKWNHVRTYVYD